MGNCFLSTHFSLTSIPSQVESIVALALVYFPQVDMRTSRRMGVMIFEFIAAI